MLNNVKLDHLMLVDDDEDDRMLFGVMSREVNPGLRVSMAKDALECLSLLRNPGFRRPQLILMDINMPLMDGFECLEKIKGDDSLKDIEVMMYSTSALPGNVERAFKMGASQYIVKPIDISSYEIILRKVFYGRNPLHSSTLSPEFVLELHPEQP